MNNNKQNLGIFLLGLAFFIELLSIVAQFIGIYLNAGELREGCYYTMFAMIFMPLGLLLALVSAIFIINNTEF